MVIEISVEPPPGRVDVTGGRFWNDAGGVPELAHLIERPAVILLNGFALVRVGLTAEIPIQRVPVQCVHTLVESRISASALIGAIAHIILHATSTS
jgi:hypothetical protein